jgi:1,4-alpha-glucan branching enzyme
MTISTVPGKMIVDHRDTGNARPILRKGRAMFEKQSMGRIDRVRVTFELPSALWAERVNLVGDFNDWDTTATPMIRNRAHASWRATIELPLGRRYLFRYLLNGAEWLNEWQADDYEETDDGVYSSVVDLGGEQAPTGSRKAQPH